MAIVPPLPVAAANLPPELPTHQRFPQGCYTGRLVTWLHERSFTGDQTTLFEKVLSVFRKYILIPTLTATVLPIVALLELPWKCITNCSYLIAYSQLLVTLPYIICMGFFSAYMPLPTNFLERRPNGVHPLLKMVRNTPTTYSREKVQEL